MELVKETNQISIDDILAMELKSLKAVMSQGHPINMQDLHNKMYKGYSLGLPKFMLNIFFIAFR